MTGLYRKELPGERQPSLLAGKFRVGSRVCQSGTEGYWENLKARSALIYKMHPSQSLVLGSKTKQPSPKSACTLRGGWSCGEEVRHNKRLIYTFPTQICY